MVALINCPECNGIVSDKASACPHCGYPMENQRPEIPRIENKDYTKICFQGITVDVTDVLHYLHEKDNTVAEFALIDAYADTSIPYSEENTNKMMNMVKHNYKMLYKVEPCLHSGIIQSNLPKCPTCGSTNLTKLGIASRAIDGAIFGRLSVEGRAQFRCNKCSYMW